MLESFKVKWGKKEMGLRTFGYISKIKAFQGSHNKNKDLIFQQQEYLRISLVNIIKFLA